MARAFIFPGPGHQAVGLARLADAIPPPVPSSTMCIGVFAKLSESRGAPGETPTLTEESNRAAGCTCGDARS